MENKIKRVAYAPNAAVTGDFFNKYCIGGWNEIDVSDTDGDLRPVALPKVGWLPIGDKKEFEEGTIFGIWNGCYVGEISRSHFTDDTHYLPPLPVLECKQEPSNPNSPMKQDENLSEKQGSISDKKQRTFEDECKSLRDTMDMISGAYKRHIASRDKRIAALEEKLRKAETQNRMLTLERDKWQSRAMEDSPEWQERFKTERESRIRVEEQLLEVTMQRDELARNTPKWKELAKFEGGLLPYNAILMGVKVMTIFARDLLRGESINMLSTFCPAKADAINRGYTHYYIVPEFKPDNTARITELEKEKLEFERRMKEYMDYAEIISRLNNIDSELAKLKGEK